MIAQDKLFVFFASLCIDGTGAYPSIRQVNNLMTKDNFN